MKSKAVISSKLSLSVWLLQQSQQPPSFLPTPPKIIPWKTMQISRELYALKAAANNNASHALRRRSRISSSTKSSEYHCILQSPAAVQSLVNIQQTLYLQSILFSWDMLNTRTIIKASTPSIQCRSHSWTYPRHTSRLSKQSSLKFRGSRVYLHLRRRHLQVFRTTWAPLNVSSPIRVSIQKHRVDKRQISGHIDPVGRQLTPSYQATKLGMKAMTTITSIRLFRKSGSQSTISSAPTRRRSCRFISIETASRARPFTSRTFQSSHF